MSQDTQTQQFQSNHRLMGPIQCKRKSRTLDHPKKTQFIRDILGLVSSEKRPLLFAFFAMTQQQQPSLYYLQFSILSTLPALIWYFSFCLARSSFLLFVNGGGKMPDRARSRWGNYLFCKPLYLLILSTSHMIQQQQ